MIKALWGYVKERKWIYSVILITILIEYSTVVVPTQVTQFIINDLSNGTLTYKQLQYYLAWLGITVVIMYGCSFIWTQWLFNGQADYQRLLKKQLFKKLAIMRTPYYNKFRSGDMMTRFTSDIDNLSVLLGYGTMSLIFVLGTFIFVLPQMIRISWSMALFGTIPLIILAYIVNKISKVQDDAIEENREAVAALSNEVLEVVEGIRVTRAYGDESLSAQKFYNKTETLVQKATKIMKYQALYGRLANILLAISTAIILLMGSIKLQQGSIELGDIVALQMYSWVLIEPLWMLSDFILVYKTGQNSFEKLDELITTGDNLEEDGTIELTQLDSIKFEKYNFSYEEGQQNILSDITVTIKKGQTLGIIGKTGSGKTTFIRQLLRQYPVGEGEFLINEQSIEEYQRQSIEKMIGYVPQEHVLFSRSVKENILMGYSGANDQEVDLAVSNAAFTKDLERMSNGYDTLIGEKGVAVSGGQKQRISIARAMIKDPELLILDDSLSAVDAKTEREIIQNIQHIRKNKTTCIVTHRLSAIEHADWVIVLDNGKIIEEGTPSDLLKTEGWYAQQYAIQQREEEF